MIIHTADLKKEMTEAVGANCLSGYFYSLVEDDVRAIASLTNPAVREIIALPSDAQALTIKYTLSDQRRSGTRMITKSEVARSGGKLVILTTDLVPGRPIHEIPLSEAPHGDGNDDQAFDTLQECIAAFDGSAFQTELVAMANRTCETQYAHLECCLSDGSCFSVVVLVRPTSWKCRLTVAIRPSEVFAPINA